MKTVYIKVGDYIPTPDGLLYIENKSGHTAAWVREYIAETDDAAYMDALTPDNLPAKYKEYCITLHDIARDLSEACAEKIKIEWEDISND